MYSVKPTIEILDTDSQLSISESKTITSGIRYAQVFIFESRLKFFAEITRLKISLNKLN